MLALSCPSVLNCVHANLMCYTSGRSFPRLWWSLTPLNNALKWNTSVYLIHEPHRDILFVMNLFVSRQIWKTIQIRRNSTQTNTYIYARYVDYIQKIEVCRLYFKKRCFSFHKRFASNHRIAGSNVDVIASSYRSPICELTEALALRGFSLIFFFHFCKTRDYSSKS